MEWSINYGERTRKIRMNGGASGKIIYFMENIVGLGYDGDTMGYTNPLRFLVLKDFNHADLLIEQR